MPYQRGLPAALARRGLKVETVPGWETRGSSNFNPVGALCHWTAGPRNAVGRPSLNVVVNGRPGLAGPLCNVYLDRNGVAVVVAAGVANHGGVGAWGGYSGNSRFFGTEAECGGDGDWSKPQRAAYPHVNAAYCDLGGFGADMIAGHHEYALPAGRKIDIRDYTMPQMRREVAALLSIGPEEDDMQLDDVIPTSATQKRVWGVDKVDVEDALLSARYARLFAYRAARDAAATLALQKAQAAKGAALDADEIKAAIAEGIASIGDEYEPTFVPKEQ